MRGIKILVVLLLGIAFNQGHSQSLRIKKQKTAEFTISEPDAVLKFDVWVWKKPLKVSPVTGRKYHWYRSNTVLATDGAFDGKLLHGNYASFYLNQNLKEKGRIKKGLKSDQWNKWNDNGNRSESTLYKKGVRNGKYILFDADGRVTETGSYKNDKKNGIIKTYSVDSLISKIKCHKGKVVESQKKALLLKINVRPKNESSDKKDAIREGKSSKGNNKQAEKKSIFNKLNFKKKAESNKASEAKPSDKKEEKKSPLAALKAKFNKGKAKEDNKENQKSGKNK
jgi:hypothetical protein